MPDDNTSQDEQTKEIADMLIDQFDKDMPEQSIPQKESEISLTSGLSLEEELLLAQGQLFDEGEQEFDEHEQEEPSTASQVSEIPQASEVPIASNDAIQVESPPQQEQLLPQQSATETIGEAGDVASPAQKPLNIPNKPKSEFGASYEVSAMMDDDAPSDEQPSRAKFGASYEVMAMMEDEDMSDYLAPVESHHSQDAAVEAPADHVDAVRAVDSTMPTLDIAAHWEEEMQALDKLEKKQPIDEPENYETALKQLAKTKHVSNGGYKQMLDTESILYAICERKRKHVDQKNTTVSEQTMLQKIRSLPEARNFIGAINTTIENAQVALIAEVKKASPSKGVIRDDFNPVEIASAYTNAGATCLSVLTDEPYFQGKDEYIDAVKIHTHLPILRKDFIIDPYQVVESRCIGADCILLIMAILDDEEAEVIEAKAIDLGMDVLVEVHNEDELHRAFKLNTKLLGINNRDLKTLKVDMQTTVELSSQVPPGYTVVCESGINNYEQILAMQEHDIHTFLVGESLMVQNDIEYAAKQLLNNHS